ncbi:hypothetical protein O5D80_004308 [Batrachochytrium dendrobatidis]|nr:hypothetical protein O5D80_004308 [Batrachochytrium dendrobatidis]
MVAAFIANVNLECCENSEIFTGIDFGITAKEKASAKRNTQSHPVRNQQNRYAMELLD